MHKVRVVLDTEEDVVRDININASESLLELHKNIIAAFQLDEGEMASFFVSNDDWEQGEEISMLDFGSLSGGKAKLMENSNLAEALVEKGSKMIYVYDFLNLWTFFLEVIEISDKTGDVEIYKIIGERPEKAPEKNMEADGDQLDTDYNSDSEFGIELEDDYLDYNLN